MLSDEAMHERMVNGWRMGRPFTVCGNGSTLDNTANIREWLPKVVNQHGITTLNDAGAGDMAWWPYIQWSTPLIYRPYDLIPRREIVQQIDITTQAMEPADAILCRMVLNHLDHERVAMALDQFRLSATYLIATQFDGESLDQRSPQFMRLDLRNWLGFPIDKMQDGVESNCYLALWRL
jgi:hypothetical protein